MAYISSTANRFYAAVESVCGVAPVPSAAHRLLAQQVQLTQRFQRSQRHDKSGFRNQASVTVLSAKETDFILQSRLTTWGASASPNLDPVWQAAFGRAARSVSGLVIAGAASSGSLKTQQAHGLSVGDALCCAGELRFVVAVSDANSVQLNSPYSVLPSSGTVISRSASYALGASLPSLSLFDYWTPASLSRVAVGGFVNDLSIRMAADGFEVQARGIAADLLEAGAEQMPTEPLPARVSANPIPAAAGALYLGAAAAAASEGVAVSGVQFFLTNNLVVRPLQFGSSLIRDVAPGIRKAQLQFNMYVTDTATSDFLYEAARRQLALPVLLQMGSRAGSSVALYLPAFVPDVPRFNDSGPKLGWQVSGNAIYGGSESEAYLAFA